MAYKVPLVVGGKESCRRRWEERLSLEEVEYAKKVVGRERENLGMCNMLHWSASAGHEVPSTEELGSSGVQSGPEGPETEPVAWLKKLLGAQVDWARGKQKSRGDQRRSTL